MIKSFYNWSERTPYGLAAMILLVQGNVVAPAISLLILYAEANLLLLYLTIILSMGLVVVNLSLQPPRFIAKCFLINLVYHLGLGGYLLGRLIFLG